MNDTNKTPRMPSFRNRCLALSVLVLSVLGVLLLMHSSPKEVAAPDPVERAFQQIGSSESDMVQAVEELTSEAGDSPMGQHMPGEAAGADDIEGMPSSLEVGGECTLRLQVSTLPKWLKHHNPDLVVNLQGLSGRVEASETSRRPNYQGFLLKFVGLDLGASYQIQVDGKAFDLVTMDDRLVFKELSLPARGSLRGRITPPPAPGEMALHVNKRVVIPIDESGHYLIEELGPGVLWLELMREGQASAIWSQRVAVWPGRMNYLDIDLRTRPRVRVDVHSIESGESLPIHVVLSRKGAPYSEVFRTFERSPVEMAVSPGDYELAVFAEGFQVPDARTLHLEPSGTENVDLSLGRELWEVVALPVDLGCQEYFWVIYWTGFESGAQFVLRGTAQARELAIPQRFLGTATLLLGCPSGESARVTVDRFGQARIIE